MRDLVMGRRLRPLPGTPLAGPAPSSGPVRGAAPANEIDLPDDDDRQVLHLRLAHLLKAETSYRSGDPSVALPGKPHPGYDPGTVPSVVQSRKNKAVEIAQAIGVLGPEAARRACIAGLSVRSLERMGAAWNRTHSLTALVDRRHLRPSTGPRLAASGSAETQEDLAALKELVRDLVFQVEEDFGPDGSKVSVQTRYRRMLFLGAEAGLSRQDLPGRETYRLIRKRWFAGDGGRAKYRRSNAALPDQMVSVKPTRPGQIVMLDASDWDALIRDGLFGDPTTAKLTLAVDVYTCSIVGFGSR